MDLAFDSTVDNVTLKIALKPSQSLAINSPLHRVPQVRERGLDMSASICSWHLHNTSKEKPQLILSNRLREIQRGGGGGKGGRAVVVYGG